MTYAETLDYLYNTLPMFSRMGSAAFKKDLTNIRALCEALDHPEKKFKSVHVAGTNGKGSVSHMLAAVFQTAGYKTGLYTSPHLYDFRERIRINSQPIAEGFVVDFTERIKPLIASVQPSFFEITVAMAFEAFAEEKVDVAVIEVGLGGRLDSTNVITPELSVITNIGWDHMNLLGNTLPEIAAEKAGIIKTAVPVVIGETLPETKTVFRSVAAKNNAKLLLAEEQWQVKETESGAQDLLVVYQNPKGETLALKTDLPGLYQVKNLRTVLAAVAALREVGWELEEEVVVQALAQVRSLTGLRGRWEVMAQSPTVVLDVAHNKNGMEELLKHVSQLSFRQLRIVFGTVKDKDVEAVLSLLPTTARYYFTQAQIPRALPATELAVKAWQNKLYGKAYAEVNLALAAAWKEAASDDLILVCGSIFLVAEVEQSLFKSLASKEA